MTQIGGQKTGPAFRIENLTRGQAMISARCVANTFWISLRGLVRRRPLTQGEGMLLSSAHSAVEQPPARSSLGAEVGGGDGGADVPDLPIKNAATALDRARDIVVALVLAAVILFRFSQTIADPDLWGHVRFGQDLWRTGTVARVDTYSYTAGDSEWINHEWLAEAIFAGLYDRLGAPGLIGFKVGVSILLAGALYAHLRARGLRSTLASILVLAAALLMFAGLYTVRPQMFSYVCFLALLTCVWQAEDGRQRWLLALPPVFALWANLHGGFLLGIGVLYAWTAVHLMAKSLQEQSWRALMAPANRTAVASVILSSLAVLLNPYGVRLVVFLLRTATVARPEISEWQPITIQSLLGVAYVILLTLAILAISYSQRRRGPAALAVFGIAAVLPAMAVRHTALFALAIVILAGEHMGDAWRRLFAHRSTPGRSARPTWPEAIVVILLLAVVGTLAVASAAHFGCITVDSSWYPVKAVAWLKAAGASGKMAVTFNWGEYVLWHLGPSVQVSVDGRRETLYPDKVYRENLAFMYGVGSWDALLRDYPTELVLVEQGSAPANLLRLSSDWVIAYEDDVSVVAARRGSPLLLRQSQDAASVEETAGVVCFP